MNEKEHQVGVQVISELKDKGLTDNEIEIILIQVLKNVISDIRKKQILEELTKMEGEKLFDGLED